MSDVDVNDEDNDGKKNDSALRRGYLKKRASNKEKGTAHREKKKT